MINVILHTQQTNILLLSWLFRPFLGLRIMHKQQIMRFSHALIQPIELVCTYMIFTPRHICFKLITPMYPPPTHAHIISIWLNLGYSSGVKISCRLNVYNEYKSKSSGRKKNQCSSVNVWTASGICKSLAAV